MEPNNDVVVETSAEEYVAPAIETYDETDTWTFAPCGQD